MIHDTDTIPAGDGPRLRDYLRYLGRRRLAKMAYGVIVCLLVGEVAIALVTPQREVLPQELVVKDSVLGFRMVPGFSGVEPQYGTELKINSIGLRERELEPSKKALRVYVLGDSIVFGLGVEADEALPRALERTLRQRLGRPIEVINGGVPGYGTLQQLKLFEETADAIRPDVVLATVSVFNDISDNVKFAVPQKRWENTPNVIYKPLRWLRERSQLYLIMRQYRSGVSAEKMMDIHAAQPSKATDRGLRITEESLVDFAKEVRRRGAAFGVVVLPAQKQVSPRTWAETLHSRGLDEKRYAREQPNRRLVDFARHQGLAVMDLLPLLYKEHEDLYDNEHWIPAGHTIVAEAIADFMENSNLIDTAVAAATATKE